MIESIDLATIFQTNQFSSTPIQDCRPYYHTSQTLHWFMKWKEGNFSLMMKIELPCPNCVRRQLEADGRGSHGERGHYPMTTGYLRQSSSTAPALERLSGGSVLEAIWKFFDVRWVVRLLLIISYRSFISPRWVWTLGHSQHSLKPVTWVAALVQESNFVIKSTKVGARDWTDDGNDEARFAAAAGCYSIFVDISI